ncbi:cupin domain-containing protein [Microvirga pakistanensis]|uniref:cupin domain-containing protein n=1 Tax=Microvirga pakistanensis TaxID=1682650 RepID=UPI0010694717|nr:cupin domain-containing protein [Microvirga pakistanensis]
MTHDSNPSYLHLRAGVPADAATPLLIPALDGDALADERSYHLSDETLGYRAGVSRSGPCNEDVRLAYTEFTVINDGEVSLLQSDGTSVTLVAGDCAVLPAGLSVRWTQSGAVSRTFMIFPGLRNGSSSAIVKIDPGSDLHASKGPARELLLTSPPPVAHSRVWFEDASGDLQIGVWECTPYSRKALKPTYCELMHILTGAVTFTHPSGRSWTIGAGETVIVPAGATNEWSSHETIRKVFCIVG